MGTLLAELDDMSPGGFAIALHIKYNAPTFLFQTFPEKWVENYTKHGLVIKDPAVHWAFANTGFIRWTELAHDDPYGVMEQSQLYGLTYGFTASIHNDNARSMAGFARADRQYLDAEIDDMIARFEALDVMTAGIEALSRKDTDALQKLSIRLTHR